MIGRFILVTLLLQPALLLANGPLNLCQNPKLVSHFLELGGGIFDTTAEGERQTFAPYMPQALECLKRWADDGGQADQLPVMSGFTREHHQTNALATLSIIAEGDEDVASWLCSSITAKKWSEGVQAAGIGALASVGGQKSLKCVRELLNRWNGMRKESAWRALAFLSPATVVSELEPLAKTRKDLELLGDTLMKVDHESVIPVLERLRELLPEHSWEYGEYISALKSAETLCEDKRFISVLLQPGDSQDDAISRTVSPKTFTSPTSGIRLKAGRTVYCA